MPNKKQQPTTTTRKRSPRVPAFASMQEYRDATEAQRRAFATAVAKDRTGGLSGAELRTKYGAWLLGPRRIAILREHGLGSVVAKSYGQYRDGDPRKGSRHAREHGPKAEAPKPPRKRTRKASPKAGK